jgi:hypothetical protein
MTGILTERKTPVNQITKTPPTKTGFQFWLINGSKIIRNKIVWQR